MAKFDNYKLTVLSGDPNMNVDDPIAFLEPWAGNHEHYRLTETQRDEAYATVEFFGEMCKQKVDTNDGRFHFTCTRTRGHEGMHIAHGVGLVAAIWSGKEK